jgi:hypothetical protein
MVYDIIFYTLSISSLSILLKMFEFFLFSIFFFTRKIYKFSWSIFFRIDVKTRKINICSKIFNTNIWERENLLLRWKKICIFSLVFLKKRKIYFIKFNLRTYDFSSIRSFFVLL